MTISSLLLAALSLTLPPQSASQGEFAWGDVDADGLLDLVVVVDGTPRLYHNAGGGAFSERSAELGLVEIDDALFGLWRDLDGDRHPELLIGRTRGVTLFENRDGRALVDVTDTCGLGELKDEVLLANWVDYDADGRFDLELRTRTRGLLFHDSGVKEKGRLLELELVASNELPGSINLSAPQAGATGGTRITPGGAGNGHSNSIVSGGCSSRILDFSNPSACLTAASVPQLGMLYPISQELFIDAATGFVGIGVTDPMGRLDVAGMIRIRSEGLEFPDGTLQTTAQLVGPAGPTGPQGDAGPAGADGADGADGNDGAQGPQGPTGPQGDAGPAGADGADGNDGAQGPQGPTGPQGDAGPAGSDGADGNDGAQGPAGPTGPQGDAGPAGADGADGNDGAQGPQGPTGPLGPPGANGSDGAPGAQGPTGPVGPDGAIGPQGPTGPEGPAGTSSWTDGAGYVSTVSEVTIGAPGSPAFGSVQVVGDSDGAVVLISPNAGVDSKAEIWLGESATGHYRMGWRYDGTFVNQMQLLAYQNGAEYGPYLTVNRSNGRMGVGVSQPTSQLDVAGEIWTRSGGLRFPDGTLQSTAQLEGPAGPTGPAGADGAAGPQGPTGPAGSDGSQGAAGSQGPAGPTGPPGMDGAPGPIGPAGPTGPAGTSSWSDGVGNVSTFDQVGIGTTNYTGALTVVNNGRAIQASSTNNTPSLFITGGSDAKTVGEAGMLQLGSTNTENMVVDSNEILARNNGATSPLYLQLDGGVLDVGGPLKLRDSVISPLVLEDTTGGVTKKVKFTVKQSSGLLDDDDDDEDDVEVTSEDEEGNEERATVTARGVNIPVPESPGVVVRVRGGTGGVSEDPLLVVAGGVQIADESGNTSALMPTLSGGLRLGAVDGPQVDIDVTASGGIDVKGPISGANVIAASLDFGGGDLDGDGLPDSSLGLNEAGQLDLQGANGFAFRTDGQQVNFNISNTGVMGFNNPFEGSAVLQIGSEVETGGLRINSGGADFEMGVSDSADPLWGDVIDLDEEIVDLVCVDLSTDTGGMAMRSASLNGGAVQAANFGLDDTVRIINQTDAMDSKLLSMNNIAADWSTSEEVFRVESSGQVVIKTHRNIYGADYAVDIDDTNAIHDNSYNAALLARTAGHTGPRAVWGYVYGQANGMYGVYGSHQYNGSNRYGVFSAGDLGTSGGKFFLQPHPSDPSKEIRFASLEGNESGTYCRGTDQIVGGVCTIELPEDFRLASEEGEITAQVTALDGPANIWVESQNRDQIIVRGTSDISFNWFVNGVRRGWSDLETIIPNTSFVPGKDEEFGEPAFGQYRPEYREILVENGILNPDFRPNIETAARMGWIPKKTEPERTKEEAEASGRKSLINAGLLTPEGHSTALAREALGAKGD